MTESTPTASSAGAVRRFLTCCSGQTERDRRNSRRTNYWLLGWMVSFIGIILTLKHGILPGGLPAWLAIAVSTALGLVAILAFVRFIREADELVRKIQLEALALGFGAGVIANFTLSLVERVREQPFDIGDLLLVMVVFYVIGVIAGSRRYA